MIANGAMEAELPPHTRGRPGAQAFRSPDQGATPACAGTTAVTSATVSVCSSYPCMRGDDVWMLPVIATVAELPRMRGDDRGSQYPR